MSCKCRRHRRAVSGETRAHLQKISGVWSPQGSGPGDPGSDLLSQALAESGKTRSPAFSLRGSMPLTHRDWRIDHAGVVTSDAQRGDWISKFCAESYLPGV